MRLEMQTYTVKYVASAPNPYLGARILNDAHKAVAGNNVASKKYV